MRPYSAFNKNRQFSLKFTKKKSKNNFKSKTKFSKKNLLKSRPKTSQKSKNKLNTGLNFDNEKNTRKYHLNQITDRSRFNQNYIQKLGNSFKNYTINLRNEEIANNLSRISTNRSLTLAKSIRKIEKMNEDFDFKYYDSYNLNFYKNQNNSPKKEKLWKLKNNNQLTEINEILLNDNDENETILEENNNNNNDLKSGLLKDEKELNIKQLIRKNQKKLSKELIQQKKLKDLQTLLKFIDKQDEVPTLNNKKKNHRMQPVILTYSNTKTFSNSRENKINTIYQPSISYNKNNLFFEKKYSLIIDKLKHNSKENNTIDINKEVCSPQKNDLKELNKSSSSHSIKTISMKSIGTLSNKNSLYSNKNIQKNNKNKNVNKNYFRDNTKSTNCISNTNKLLKPKTKNSSKKNKRNDKNSRNNSTHSNFNTIDNNIYNSDPIRVKKSDSLKKNKIITKKQIVPLVNKLLTEGDEIENEIKIKVKSLNGLNASDITAYNKRHKNRLNVEKIRKKYNLDDVNPVINEENILIKNAKIVGKTLNNHQKAFLLTVAKTVVREDMLANKFVNCDHSLMFKLNFLNERRKNRFKFVLEKDNQNIKKKKSEIEKLFKVMKHNLPNFCDLNSLQSAIYKYRTLRFSPSKVI